jgi:general secretion pathway protein G
MKSSAPDKSRFFSWKTLILVWATFLGGGALLVGANMVQTPGVINAGRSGSVRAHLSALNTALLLYKMKSGQLPTTEQGLAVLVEKPVLEPVPQSWAQQLTGFDVLKDPWGNEYVYSLGPNEDGFQIHSLGPDGLDQTDDDITHTHEAPTSSM